jgi:hypothetical protein
MLFGPTVSQRRGPQARGSPLVFRLLARIGRIPKEYQVNKRKKVAIQKHRAKAKKLEEKRKLGALARRTK